MFSSTRFGAAVFLGVSFWMAALATSVAVAPTLTTWHPLRIGAGGFLTGIDISADGSTRVVRADTYGAYVWESPLSQWKQIVTVVDARRRYWG
jgi:hypothetical protein